MHRILMVLLFAGVYPMQAVAEDCSPVVSTDIDPDKRPSEYGKVLLTTRSGNSNLHYVDIDRDRVGDLLIYDHGVDWKMDAIMYLHACPVEDSEND